MLLLGHWVWESPSLRGGAGSPQPQGSVLTPQGCSCPGGGFAGAVGQSPHITWALLALLPLSLAALRMGHHISPAWLQLNPGLEQYLCYEACVILYL